MTKEQTRKKIIKKTLELIGKKGYDKISARMVAREAKISVSTLFYHFPDGIFDILLSSFDVLREKLQMKKIFDDGEISDKEIFELLKRQLKIGREMSDVLMALESALYANPEHFKSKASEVSLDSNEDFMMMKKIYEKIIGQEIKIKLYIRLLSAWKALMHRHIILDNIFGSDDEFINMIFRIFRAIAMEE